MEDCDLCDRESEMEKEAARKRILVIDDDEGVLMTLESLLENEGYETITAWSGQEGLALLRSQEFDLVLLDDYLRDVEHEEIFSVIRRMAIQPPVILTESSPTSSARGYYLDLGACAVVSKRAPVEQIAAEIHRCLTRAATMTVPV
jgi:DNA-binding response OmpR family regulator